MIATWYHSIMILQVSCASMILCFPNDQCFHYNNWVTVDFISKLLDKFSVELAADKTNSCWSGWFQSRSVYNLFIPPWRRRRMLMLITVNVFLSRWLWPVCKSWKKLLVALLYIIGNWYFRVANSKTQAGLQTCFWNIKLFLWFQIAQLIVTIFLEGCEKHITPFTFQEMIYPIDKEETRVFKRWTISIYYCPDCFRYFTIFEYMIDYLLYSLAEKTISTSICSNFSKSSFYWQFLSNQFDKYLGDLISQY